MEPTRKRSKLLWLWLLLLLPVLLAAIGFFYLQHSVNNVMYPALDALSPVAFGERWSRPEMIHIRELGARAVGPLRRVLHEKQSAPVAFLDWAKAKWPNATNYYSHFPDKRKMTERRQMACQALQTLGPAARPAVPELIEIFRGKDLGDVNSAQMALWSIGIDAEIVDRLDALLESNVPDFSSGSIISALGSVKPPSNRTIKVLIAQLKRPTPYLQAYAADALGALAVNTPEVMEGLKSLQSSSTNELVLMNTSIALWKLNKDADAALPAIFHLLETMTPKLKPSQFGGGGQGVDADEQLVMRAAWQLSEMPLDDANRARALSLLEKACDNSTRIFIRMLLLDSMIRLGLTQDKCMAVCREGLAQNEEYYRLQAAQLLGSVAKKFPLDSLNLDELLHDRDVGVRVYSARAHWLKHHDAKPIVPVLVESLDREKYQSYYYAQTLPAALRGIEDIGTEAAAAVEPVKKLTADPDPNISKLAAETLAKISK